MGLGVMVPFFCALLAEGHEQCGELKEAQKLLNKGLAHANQNYHGFWDAELYRLQGTFLYDHSAKDTHEESESHFEKALSVAREQGAKPFELRAAASLAQLYNYRAETEEARDILTPVFDWFTEGFDTPDLKKAKALLVQLS